MGTQLGTGHPALVSMLAGQPRTGLALLLGKPYMTRYQPVRDGGANAVGILFTRLDLSAW